MPELPEVETVRRTLAPAVGQLVTSVWCSGEPLHMKRPIDTKALKRLRGQSIAELRRIGKYLFVDFDRATICFHLGMTGRLQLVAPRGARSDKHAHVVLKLAGDRVMRFWDSRRFGQVLCFARNGETNNDSIAKLGIDALTGHIDGKWLYEKTRRSKRTLKALLMDQTTIAGVGNIYASEILWLAKLLPTRRAHELTKPECTRLAKSVKAIINRALDDGGTSLRDFVDATGVSGAHANYLYVYDRAPGQCPRRGCRGTLTREVLQGRASYWCRRCQS